MTGQLRLTLPGSTTQYDPKDLYVETGEFISANCFCRKSVLERVGGFEEAFDSAWREDSDLQFKFIQAGIPIGKCPEAIVVHPIRETPWYTSLANERKRQYDALLYKRHPDLFRQRIQTDRGQILEYYASVLAVAVGTLGALSGNTAVAAVGLGLWAILLTNLIGQRLPTNAANAHPSQTLLTALATPFLSVYWRLYGAVKYRVLYW